MTEPFDRAALRAYIAKHRLSEPEMAAHAGIPYRTLRGILCSSREPQHKTRAAIEHALTLPPPPRKPLPHSAEIARLWPQHGSTVISRRLGITPMRVRQIAKALGLGQPDRRRRVTI